MRTFLRSFLIVCASAPAFACSAQSDEDTATTAEALCKDPPCGVIDPLPPPPPPPPYVSPPDVAFQIIACLSPDQETRLAAAMHAALPQAVDVLPSCTGSNERVGIWLRPEVGVDNLAARQRGLPGVNIVAAGELFAAHIRGTYLTGAAYAGWAAAPKVLSAGGSANPGGPIHLHDFNIATAGPKQWVTTITGTDTDPWPDVDFTLKTTDTLSTLDGRIQCDSKNTFDADTGLLNVLTGVFLIAFPPLGGFFLYEDVMVSGADVPNTSSGSIVCPAVKIFPSQVLLPPSTPPGATNQKATFTYTRAQADGTGITVGGAIAIVNRAPTASIGGASAISVEAGSTQATGSFVANLADMRAPFTYTWSASGFVSAFHASGTNVRFTLTGSEAVGSTKSESVHLHVVDVDSATLDVTKVVTVRFTDPDPIPPVCKVKPYLPQCQNL